MNEAATVWAEKAFIIFNECKNYIDPFKVNTYKNYAGCQKMSFTELGSGQPISISCFFGRFLLRLSGIKRSQVMAIGHLAPEH